MLIPVVASQFVLFTLRVFLAFGIVVVVKQNVVF